MGLLALSNFWSLPFEPAIIKKKKKKKIYVKDLTFIY